MGKKVKRKCPVCGKTYIADATRLKWGRETTCSRKCSYQLRAEKKRSSTVLLCPVCGKEFGRSPAQMKYIKYTNVCSLKCLYKGRSLGIIPRVVKKPYKTPGPTLIDRVCQHCDVEFKDHLGVSRKYCSRKCSDAIRSERMAGEGNPSYIDGSSMNHQTFRGSDWAIIRRKVYKRDDYICQKCGVKCISKQSYTSATTDQIIQCHHIKPYESPADNEMDNLVTLCLKCHLQTHNKTCD